MPARHASTQNLQLSAEVQAALDEGRPLVALESTVIAHGLPHPTNLEIARRMEAVVREAGAVPATVGVIDGLLTVGLNDAQLEFMATGHNIRKASVRDLSILAARQANGATTVATTALAAHWAGIRIFATGGIGGVHRGYAGDISADLPVLANTPVAVVCAGAKAILDLPRTREWLETHGVPVIGYQTDVVPAFYAVTSGLPVDARAENAHEVAAILHAQWSMDLRGGVLLVVPPPEKMALSAAQLESAIEAALAEADQQGIDGKELTPFLLTHVSKVTQGRSQAVNVALLEQNALIAAQVAVALAARGKDIPLFAKEHP